MAVIQLERKSQRTSKRAKTSVKPVRVLQLFDAPRIIVIENFLQPEQCDHLITLAKRKLKRSQGFDVVTGKSSPTEIRTSSHAWLQIRQDEMVAQLENQISELTKFPVENGEGLQILRYKIGQEYKAHHDYFDPIFPGSSVSLKRGGQRIATLLMYLADVEEGGETIFPRLDIKVRPTKGSALFFTNVMPDFSLAEDSLHASIPVVKGEKWVATKWIRQRAFESKELTENAS